MLDLSAFTLSTFESSYLYLQQLAADRYDCRAPAPSSRRPPSEAEDQDTSINGDRLHERLGIDPRISYLLTATH
jgi:hypothetical protein